MTTQNSFVKLSPLAISSHIGRKASLALLCAMPLMASAQTTTPGSAAVPTIAENLSVWPKNGQTEEQLAADRADCQRWAKSQAGFDPTQYGGGVGPTDFNARRQQYGRAMAACLEGHGYSVHFAAPVNTAPPTFTAQAAPTLPAAPPPAAAPPIVVRDLPPPPPPPPPTPELKYRPLALQIEGGYTLTTGATGQNIDDGGNIGLGLSLFPISALPVGIRLDGSYSWFEAKNQLLSAGNFTSGHEDFYGGDADLQLNLARSSSAFQFYLFGGAGLYREQTLLRQESIVSGTVCGFYFCGPGYYRAITAEEHTITGWNKAWNAGLGWEAAIGDRATFFMEARYLRILPNSNQTKFVPIRFGFRF